MDKAEFDRFADEYYALHKDNVRISGETPDFFAEYKVQDTFDLSRNSAHTVNRILDFGAGVGNAIPYFEKFFPKTSLICVDISNRCLEVARRRFPKSSEFVCFNGISLPFPDDSFDLIFAACVFHHIPKNRHTALLREWYRVLVPQGMAVIFEHNPWNPLTTHAVKTCVFDQNAELISGPALRRNVVESGFEQPGLHFRLFVPGLLRSLRPLERWLRWCPVGAQYVVFATK